LPIELNKSIGFAGRAKKTFSTKKTKMILDKNKKSQATIFVLLGILLLIIIGVSIYVFSVLQNSVTKEEEYTENIPAEMQPIKTVVEQCLQSTAQDAFIVIGQQGGYAYPGQAGIIPVEDRETSSSAIFFAPGSNITIPYWYYMKSSNRCTSCQFATERPALHKNPNLPSVESEAEKFVENNLEYCMDFSEFQKRGYRIQKPQDFSVEVKITDQDVGLFLKYPLQVKKDNKNVKMSLFQNRLDLEFKKIFDTASAIAQEWEVSDYKALETTTMELVSGYSLEGSDYDIPPVSGPIKFGLEQPQTWMLGDVSQNMKSILSQNIPLVQVEGSKQFRIYTFENKFSNSFYNNMVMPLLTIPDSELEKIKAEFSYLPWWELYLRVDPSKGELITPDQAFSINLAIFSFSMQEYDFSYDISYPVMVSLSDDSAFNNRGYTFQYALEVNIRNNQPLNSTQLNISRADAGMETLFGNQNQRVANLNLETKDFMTGQPLEKVLISYHCGDDVVYLGETLLENSNAILSTKIPKCAGGVLVGEKQDFVSEPYTLSIEQGETANVTLNLFPIVAKKLVVKKRIITKQVMDRETGGSILDNPLLERFAVWAYQNKTDQDLSLDDRAIIILERQSTLEDNFVEMKSFTGSEEEGQTVRLAIGQYSLETFLMRELGEGKLLQNFVIQEREECTGGSLFSGEECYTIPEIQFNGSLYLGGYSLDNSSNMINITKQDLEKDTITIYVVGVDIDSLTKAEDLEQLDKTQEYVDQDLASVQPNFS